MKGVRGMGRCIILAPLYRGEERAWLTPGAGDLLLCADGGYEAARAAGFTPDLTIGDFDSMPRERVAGPVVALPTHKDDTDLVACLSAGRARGYRSFRLAGCVGGRLDHTLAAVQCLADCALRGEEAWMADAGSRMTILSPGEYTVERLPGRKLSLLAFSEEVRGVDVHGTEWELDGATLTSRYPLGISNEFRGDAAHIALREGLLMLLLSWDGGRTGSG